MVRHRGPPGYMLMADGRREDIGLRRYSSSLEEKVADAKGPVYALVPRDFPTSEDQLRRLEDSGYRLVPVEEGRLYRIVSDEPGGVRT